MQIWKRARQDTWEWVKRHVGITIIVSGLGLPAGFFVLESERAKDELHILLVYTITPISILIVLVFLYNLWLAPYREVWDRLDLIEEHRDAPVQAERVVNTTPANLDDWRHVQELKVYQIAELSGGISPPRTSEGSTARARAICTELVAALRARKIKGHWAPKFANNVTRIKRKELPRYFKGRDDYPDFLRDPDS